MMGEDPDISLTRFTAKNLPDPAGLQTPVSSPFPFARTKHGESVFMFLCSSRLEINFQSVCALPALHSLSNRFFLARA